MNTGHRLRGRLLLALQERDLMVVARGLHCQVTKPAVRVNGAPRLDGFLDERHQACRRGVWDVTHTNAPDPRSIFLCCNDNQSLPSHVAAACALIYAGGEGLVYLDSARQSVPAWPHHRASQLVQPSPGGL